MEKNGAAGTRLRRAHIVADDDQQVVDPVMSPELFGVSGVGPFDQLVVLRVIGIVDPAMRLALRRHREIGLGKADAIRPIHPERQ